MEEKDTGKQLEIINSKRYGYRLHKYHHPENMN